MDWTRIWAATGALGGLIGGITGAISLIKVNEIKSSDLRMECGRLRNSIRVLLNNLNELCTKADQSKIYRFAAQGISKSGAMQKWQNNLQEIKQTISDLSLQFDNDSEENLETEILNLHSIEIQLKSVEKDLIASMTEDDLARERLSKIKHGA